MESDERVSIKTIDPLGQLISGDHGDKLLCSSTRL
jgi:hypothetical protein